MLVCNIIYKHEIYLSILSLLFSILSLLFLILSLLFSILSLLFSILSLLFSILLLLLFFIYKNYRYIIQRQKSSRDSFCRSNDRFQRLVKMHLNTNRTQARSRLVKTLSVQLLLRSGNYRYSPTRVNRHGPVSRRYTILYI